MSGYWDGVDVNNKFMFCCDANKCAWLYHRKHHVFMPFVQELEPITLTSEPGKIQFGNRRVSWQLPSPSIVKDLVDDLSQLAEELSKDMGWLNLSRGKQNGWLFKVGKAKLLLEGKELFYDCAKEAISPVKPNLELQKIVCYVIPTSESFSVGNIVKSAGLTQCFRKEAFDCENYPKPSNGSTVTPKDKEARIKELKECDLRRCKLGEYEESRLSDINQGHWEVMQEDQDTYDFIYRDPRKDVRVGVVGIDFGTKSTVVVRQGDTDNIVPVRIGSTDLKNEVKEEDFENPTVIECVNLAEFLKCYKEKKSRPHTSCNDVCVSYDAANDFNARSLDNFYSFCFELKQWANQHCEDSVNSVKIQDQQKKTYELSFSEKSEAINPIELYAYYIGLLINNMRNGVYLKYLLSFPVGYAKDVKDKILQSFAKGIKKSLPQEIIEDKALMQEYSVEYGISEPAAYAIAALQCDDRFDPADENEKYLYGIFDFGGGTTDFDFGFWRGASEEEYDNKGYDYVLECFGADSDKTLGGENILSLLAYEVFMDECNRKTVRDNALVITPIAGKAPLAGTEMIIDATSRIAMRNMSILKEEFRSLWHQEEDIKDKYSIEEEDGVEKGFIEVTLYDIDEQAKPGCKFYFEVEQLENLMRERIKQGVESFFRCLQRNTATAAYKKISGVEDIKKIHIFLAGNSCKSKFVRELFEEKIKEYTEKLELQGNAQEALFELVDTPDGQNGNRKTRVAYGLVLSREGSTINVVKNYQNDTSQETRFKYCLGRERRGNFDCKLSPIVNPYEQWVKFGGAGTSVVRIYYSDNPRADSAKEKMPIAGVKYKEIRLEPKEGHYIYVKSVAPDTFAYAVATSEKDITTVQTEKL